ncbi:glycosyltransferase family 9 protein [Microbacterium ureisolvens]|uniref:Glycosyltransferase family 9 protein n=1 Tax=Microbacterium ureisolvens TaxID=2781186 RepID=A0ABS7I5C3_9MICO|nr:glycosyltransferase family 9 protein [Microbacterium ureisolvens]MBW9111860.1 glycosyltransferase family 9 protein [Microbacterium ureisolvens]
MLEHLARASASGGIRVAVVRNDGIGDWLLTIPLLAALRGSQFVRDVTVVAPRGYRALLNRSGAVGYVDFLAGTIVAPPPPGGTLGKIRAASWLTGRRAAALGRRLRDEFDLVILPRWDTDLGFNARLLAAAQQAPIVGHDPRLVPALTSRERREGRLLSVAVASPDASKHEVEHLRALMASIGLGGTIDAGFGLDFFGVDRELSPGAPVVIHPTSVEPKRQWPIESWRKLITALESFTSVVVIGAASERETLERIVSGFGAHVTAAPGTIQLGELPGFLAGARAFVGNDSGPAHIAASVACPVVVVSPHPADGDPTHRNSPDRFRPWGRDVEVVRPARGLAPCTSACVALEPHCIATVSVRDVLAALDKLAVH